MRRSLVSNPQLEYVAFRLTGPLLDFAIGSLVGMFTMLITLPIPGFITKKNAEFQTQRMAAVGGTFVRMAVIDELPD